MSLPPLPPPPPFPSHRIAASSGDDERRAPLAQKHAVYSDTHTRAAYTPGYSRFVAWMKIILPLIAVMLLAMVAAWPYLQKKDNLFRLGFSALTMSDTETSGMVNVRYVGADSKGQPFSVTADLARSSDKSAATIDLELPKADITLKDGSWVALTADTGRYLRAEGVLDLKGKVNVFHDSGYELKTDAAELNLKQGTVISHTTVHGQGPIGEIRSQGMTLFDKGETIVFTGKTYLTLYPGPRKSASVSGGTQQ